MVTVFLNRTDTPKYVSQSMMIKQKILREGEEKILFTLFISTATQEYLGIYCITLLTRKDTEERGSNEKPSGAHSLSLEDDEKPLLSLLIVDSLSLSF